MKFLMIFFFHKYTCYILKNCSNYSKKINLKTQFLQKLKIVKYLKNKVILYKKKIVYFYITSLLLLIFLYGMNFFTYISNIFSKHGMYSKSSTFQLNFKLNYLFRQYFIYCNKI